MNAPSVLFVVDRPGWAHDRKADALARALSGRFRIVKRFQHEVSVAEVRDADLVLVFYWLQIDRVPEIGEALRAARHKLLVGICSHFELEGDMGAPGLELLATLPRELFANNRGLVERFESLLGRRIRETPNGVDTRFFVPRARESARARFRVGWAGSLTNHGPLQRGVHDVIEPAVGMVDGVELVVAAREERWRGPDEMLAFYHSLDAYVCASRSEGTPNPCLEAAACGLPIVTTRVGNMPELVVDGENGFFFDRTPDDLAAKLRVLRDDLALRARIGAAARRSIETWDWRFRALPYAEMFAALVDPPAR